MTCPMRPEPLEDRITPSALVPTISADGKMATFVDVDGDVFHVTTNKGAFVAGNFTYEGDELTGQGYLKIIDLSAANYGATFKGATIAVTLDQLVGDGFADVGVINAAGIDLKQAAVDGDLVSIDVGNANLRTPAIGLLQAGSLGFHDFSDVGLSSNISHIKGRISTLEIGDWINAEVHVSDTGLVDPNATPSAAAKFGSIGRASIGSITGGDGAESATLKTSGGIRTLVVSGTITGGVGANSGSIHCGGRITSISVGGSVISSYGNESGSVWASSIGQVSIGGDFAYEDGTGGGGAFFVSGSVRSVTIGGNMSSDFFAKAVRSITIDGNYSGNIEVDTTLTRMVVGSISGGVISALGPTQGGVAIGTIIVHGDVENAEILAGYSTQVSSPNPNARIGNVTVGGSLVATDIVAGIDLVNGVVGDDDDRLPTTDSRPRFHSSISKISVGVAIAGTDSETDQFGIQAERIGTVTVAGTKLALNPRGVDDLELGTAGDYRLREIVPGA